MAQRRMFSKKIVETDYFMEMSPTAKLLYFYLNMSADDDGFVGNPKMIKMVSGATDDDFKILVAKQFIILFESGVIVVKDWKIHNYIQKDRYNKTQYTEEKSQLIVEENGTYTKCIQDGYTLDTQVRLGKERLGKERKGKESIEYIAEENFIFPDYLSEKAVNQIKKGNPKNYKLRLPIAYLNQVTEKNFQFVEKNTKLINSRLSEGYELEDFKTVVDIKFDEWKGTEMAKFIRPETLFGTKFDGYLNQIPSKQVNNDFIDDGLDLPF